MKIRWQSLLAALAIWVWIVLPGAVQADVTTTTSGDSAAAGASSTLVPFRATRSDVDGRKSKDRHSRHGDWRREKSEEFRSFIQTELAANPALNRRVVKLSDIHARRQALQKRRQAAAEQTTASREVVVKKFHTLLREDMELAEQARRIAREIADDMPRIKNQLQERRGELSASLAQAETADQDSGTTSSAARDLRRRLHYLDFLERKLESIKTHPERLDLLARMVRGGPSDDGGQSRGSDRSGRSAGKRTHDSDDRPEGNRDLDQLKRRRRMLERELREVESKIEKMDEAGAAGSAGKEENAGRL